MDRDITLGTELAGYVVESLIGRGGMGVVYLARDERLGRKVALKILAPDLAEDEEFRARFVRESRIAAGLEHPNIVPIYEADEAAGYLFIAMRYVGGTDLQALVRRAGPVGPANAVSIVEQTGRALDAAHAQGLVHRDVKPANILLTPPREEGEAEHVYLTDFGITKRTGTLGTPIGSARVMGSVDYVAPEQIEGDQIDGRADVYSLGCVLYQCLTGVVPYPRDSEIAVLWSHVNDDPPRVTAVRPDLPRTVDEVVARALAKAAEDRYATAGALAAAASAALERGSERDARTVPITYEPSRHRRAGGRRWLVAAGAAVVVAAAAGSAIALLTGGEAGGETAIWRVQASAANAVQFVGSGPGGVRAMAAGEGAVWLATSSGITKFDDRTEARTDIALSPAPSGVVVQGTSGVWLVGTDGDDGVLSRIDPATDLRTAEVALPGTPADDVAAGKREVWVLSSGTGLLLRADAVHPREIRRIDVGVGANDLAVGGRYVWVVDNGNRTVIALDRATGKRAHAPVSLPGPATAVAAGAGRVWVLDAPDGEVVPVDPTKFTAGPPVPVGRDPTDVTVGTDGIWVSVGREVVVIDPVTLETRAVRVGRPVLDVTAGHTLGATRKVIWLLVGPGGG